ncbi:hypothetical protein [Undibacterium umbellatum]|uniref:Uncharacterized protein n=1 Tax=Undibacterium umbellatum TaxID=2762300 RepID=A0ABR6ZIC6_9BURK|nr:hypothetical protein [Undibacterium umbellatum]MBC3911481.1 hypothetical protein [Undibacterium umbellatum]
MHFLFELAKVEDAYQFIKEKIIPDLPSTTLNMWSSDIGFDLLVASPGDLHEHGVGEALAEIPEHSKEFLELMEVPLSEVESIEKTAWYQLRCAYIPILSAQHWHLQVPREMLAKHVAAVCEFNVGQKLPEK